MLKSGVDAGKGSSLGPATGVDCAGSAMIASSLAGSGVKGGASVLGGSAARGGRASVVPIRIGVMPSAAVRLTSSSAFLVITTFFGPIPLPHPIDFARRRLSLALSFTHV